MNDAKIYAVEVPEVGTFMVRRRTMRDEMRIGLEYSRLTEGAATLAPWFADLCQVVATLRVLVAEGPQGWSVDGLDPLAEDAFHELMKVFNAIRERENFFRKGSGTGEPPGREAAVPDGGVVVPAAVPAGAD